LKVAFPYPAYWPYSRRGVERCIHDLAGHLARRGHDVHIITTTPGRPRVAQEGEVKVTYLPTLTHPLMWWYAALSSAHVFGLRAAQVMHRERSDVMHVWSCAYLLAAPLLRRTSGTRSLFHFMAPYFAPNRIERRLFTSQVRSADNVVALTADAARSVQRDFGACCGVLPPPVDMDTFRPLAKSDPTHPVVFFPADMGDPRKGGKLLLRAWNRVHRESPRARLVLGGPFGLAGWFPYEFWGAMLGRFDLVEDPAARAAIEVRGPGDVDALPTWYSKSTVTVLPSYWEPFGMVLTESLACGTPVVCSSDAGPGEIVNSPEIGLKVAINGPEDVESERRVDELAEAILGAIELAAQPSTAARCRERASHWSLDRIGLMEEQLLIEAADGSRRAEHSLPLRAKLEPEVEEAAGRRGRP
jgi:glycosyltransferase involved in cell wall biosynthesis